MPRSLRHAVRLAGNIRLAAGHDWCQGTCHAPHLTLFDTRDRLVHGVAYHALGL